MLPYPNCFSFFAVILAALTDMKLQNNMHTLA